MKGYGVAVSGLVVALTFALAGVAISEGLKADALESIEAGGDVYCTWDMFGLDAPVPREQAKKLEKIDGVIRAVPRIIGRVPLGDELVMVVGVPFAEIHGIAGLPDGESIAVEGAMPRSEADVLVGRELARIFDLKPGRSVALNAHTSRVFTVSGIVSATSLALPACWSPWIAKAIICDLEEAALLFGEREHIGDICLYTRAGYAPLVAEKVTHIDRRFRVQTKSQISSDIMHGMTLREGAFTVIWAVVLAVAVPSFAVMTYLGHTPRRREIGLLKAEGWQTRDVLEMVALENIILSVLTSAGSLLLALIWVRWLRAPLISSFLIADWHSQLAGQSQPAIPAFPAMTIPSRFMPLPILMSFTFSLVVTMTGSIYATWRTAITKPVEVLR